MQLPWRISHWRPGCLGFRPTLPSATVCLLAASCVGLAAWYAACLPGGAAQSTLSEWAGLAASGLCKGRLWQPLTSLFLPGSVTWLLLVELPILFLAGRHLESVVGRRHLAALFLTGGTVGGLAQVAVGWAHGAADPLVAGPGAGVTAVFVALACVMPETDVVPPLSLSTHGAGWLRTKHGALAAVLMAGVAVVAAEAMAAWTGKPEPGLEMLAVRVLAASIVACVYMRQLGFGRRAVRSPEEEAAWAAASLQEDEEEDEEPVFAAPVAAAAGRLVVPRFTEVERRMSAREYISVRIDPILEKISRHGLGSLTDEERRALENARQKIARRK